MIPYLKNEKRNIYTYNSTLLSVCLIQSKFSGVHRVKKLVNPHIFQQTVLKKFCSINFGVAKAGYPKNKYFCVQYVVVLFEKPLFKELKNNLIKFCAYSVCFNIVMPDKLIFLKRIVPLKHDIGLVQLT